MGGVKLHKMERLKSKLYLSRCTYLSPLGTFNQKERDTKITVSKLCAYSEKIILPEKRL